MASNIFLDAHMVDMLMDRQRTPEQKVARAARTSRICNQPDALKERYKALADRCADVAAENARKRKRAEVMDALLNGSGLDHVLALGDLALLRDATDVALARQAWVEDGLYPSVGSK